MLIDSLDKSSYQDKAQPSVKGVSMSNNTTPTKEILFKEGCEPKHNQISDWYSQSTEPLMFIEQRVSFLEEEDIGGLPSKKYPSRQDYERLMEDIASCED